MHQFKRLPSSIGSDATKDLFQLNDVIQRVISMQSGRPIDIEHLKARTRLVLDCLRHEQDGGYHAGLRYEAIFDVDKYTLEYEARRKPENKDDDVRWANVNYDFRNLMHKALSKFAFLTTQTSVTCGIMLFKAVDVYNLKQKAISKLSACVQHMMSKFWVGRYTLTIYQQETFLHLAIN